jgi:hypothetical protein
MNKMGLKELGRIIKIPNIKKNERNTHNKFQ